MYLVDSGLTTCPKELPIAFKYRIPFSHLFTLLSVLAPCQKNRPPIARPCSHPPNSPIIPLIPLHPPRVLAGHVSTRSLHSFHGIDLQIRRWQRQTLRSEVCDTDRRAVWLVGSRAASKSTRKERSRFLRGRARGFGCSLFGTRDEELW